MITHQYRKKVETKTSRTLLCLLLTLVLTIGLTTYVSACLWESPFEPVGSSRSDGRNPLSASAKADEYPQAGSVMLTCRTYEAWRVTEHGCIVPFMMRNYEGSGINLAQGSYLQIEARSPTLPDGLFGEVVTIEMPADHNTEISQFYFEYGPLGCHFDSPVEIWFKWSDLGSDNAILFDIDEIGSYIQQDPAQRDDKGKRLKMHVDRIMLCHCREPLRKVRTTGIVFADI